MVWQQEHHTNSSTSDGRAPEITLFASLSQDWGVKPEKKKRKFYLISSLKFHGGGYSIISLNNLCLPFTALFFFPERFSQCLNVVFANIYWIYHFLFYQLGYTLNIRLWSCIVNTDFNGFIELSDTVLVNNFQLGN